MLLTPDQLELLTGYRRPAQQLRWLRDRQIPAYCERRHGRLRLVVRQVDADRLFEKDSGAEPDFSRLAQR